MSQLLTLIWLKWKLLRNSLRSSKAVVNQIATILGMLIALSLAFLLALGLGLAAYALSQPNALGNAFRRTAAPQVASTASAEFIFFSILGFIYLMWATLPLSIGGSKQFDAGKLLMYPISLRKLFAVDFISEITTLQSVFAIPAILAISIGAGLGSGNLTTTLLAAIPAIVFGVALSKWLSTTIGLLVRRKRARGETIVALIGVLAGLGGALAGQVAPILFRYSETIRSLRWTPPGAAAFMLVGEGAKNPTAYGSALLTLSGYSIALIIGTYWIARRAALGLGGKQRQKATVNPMLETPVYSGWQLPLMSSQLSALVEKELRYAMRNAQLRMLAFMPLVLILIRLINSRKAGTAWGARTEPASSNFWIYGSGLLATGGVLYVFLTLAGLSCNLFAFEEGGMRTLILSPIERSKILMGKNIAVSILALTFSSLLLLINILVFRDLTLFALLFAGLSFVVFWALMSVIGNWFSVRFPKRMQFGKRLNVSGVAGLLLIPMIILLSLPPLIAVGVGFYAHSLFAEYVTLAAFAVLSVGFYFLMIGFQGNSLQRREIDILESVREPSNE
jgi:hypothetical protein